MIYAYVLPQFLDLYIFFVSELDTGNYMNDLYLGFSDSTFHRSKLLGNPKLPEDIILQFQGLGSPGPNPLQPFLFHFVCLMRTILRSKVFLPLVPVTSRVQLRCKAKVQIKELRKNKGTDQ